MKRLLAIVRSLPLAVWDFFAEDGSIVAGAAVALVLTAGLAIARPFAHAAVLAGPLLFLLIAALLAGNVWRVVLRSRR